MPTEPLSRLHGVSIGEKIAKLSDFIASDLDARTANGLHGAGGCYLLLARSVESPAAQALCAHAARLAVSGIRVKVIFSEADSAIRLPAPFALPSECRLARDPRLLAAHEQLVLTPTCVWTGDCMRRDPSKRDAYEHFAANCAETATMAARSFEKLWKAAAPFESIPRLSATLASHMPEFTGGESLVELLRRQ